MELIGLLKCMCLCIGSLQKATSVEARNQGLCKIRYNFTVIMESEGTSIYLYSISGSTDVQYEYLVCLQEECEQ
jgi:hypothetical protein